MNTLQNLTNIVTSLVGRLNRIETNSKKTEELPSQTTLDPATLLRGSRGGVSEKLSIQQIINAIENGNYNQLISVNGISVVEESGEFEIIIESGVVWTINNIIYQTTSEIVIPTTLSGTGTNRIDILVGNNSNEIILISGEETEGIAVAPATPFDSVFITQINVTDGSVGTPTDPLVGTQFKKKSESSAFVDGSLTGEKAVIQLRPQGNSFYAIASGGLVSIDGFGLDLITGNPSAEAPYNGKDLIIQNLNAEPFDLLHEGDGMATTKFRFFNEHNLTVPPQGVVLLKYFTPYCEVVFKSWSESSDVLEFADLASFPATGESGKIYIALDTNLQYRWSGSVYLKLGDTQVYKTITGNTTVDDTFHNCICQITSTCMITIPTGLRADWNAVFDAVGSVTGTFVENGTTFSAPFGNKLSNNAIGSIYKTAVANFRLNGGFTV